MLYSIINLGLHNQMEGLCYRK